MQHNPFLSTPEAVAFWQDQRKACEEARRALVQHPIFAAFLAAGGAIDVIPGLAPQHRYRGFVAVLKDGDSIVLAVPFNRGGFIQIGTGSQDSVQRLTNWLNEANSGIPADAEGYYQEQEDPTDNPEYPFK